VDNVMLTATDGPVPYVPDPIALLWYKCLRRYQKIPLAYQFRAQVAGENNYIAPIVYPVQALDVPPSTPAFALTGTAGVDYSNVNAGSTAVVAFDDKRLTINIQATAIGPCWMRNQSIVADAGWF
jgi:hypothetical protein